MCARACVQVCMCMCMCVCEFELAPVCCNVNVFLYCVTDANKVRYDLCLVQYHFLGEPHELHIRPHGNSKVGRPYAQSMKSLQER